MGNIIIESKIINVGLRLKKWLLPIAMKTHESANSKYANLLLNRGLSQIKAI